MYKEEIKAGTSLIEATIMIGVLAVLSLTIIGGALYVLRTIGANQARTIALGIATQHIETIRNMPYDEVGVTTGWPPGSIPASQDIALDKFTFTVTTDVRFIDDPFDGYATNTPMGKPIDTEPSDYKRAEVGVCWNLYPCTNPVSLITTVVPNGVESAPGTGSLFVQVFDANGLPVPQADVTVNNTNLSILINNTTDNSGNLQLLSLPPDINNYNINVTKSGFSSDYTLPTTGPNPNPVQPDASVTAGAVTETSFAIDAISTLNVTTVDSTCAAVPNIPFDIKGAKLIGSSPDVLKYDTSFTTDGGGTYTNSSLEWDTYTLTLTDPTYDIAGSSLFLPLSVLAGTTQDLTVNLATTSANSLLVSIKNASGLPLTGADIRAQDSGSYDETQTTGQGSVQQDRWTGGAGQTTFSSTTQYFSDDGNVDISVNSQIALVSDTNVWNHAEPFTGTTYEDVGATTADWDTTNNYLELADDAGSPGNYLATGQGQSLKVNSAQGRITKATLTVLENLNGQTINYFLSSDGGVNFEPVTPGVEHTFAIVGTDLRWRAVLSTADTLVTPQLLSVSIAYTEVAYRASATLTSSSFNTGAGSNYDRLRFLPLSQPPATGPNAVRFQVASNNDNATWNYLGPDGTASTYYTVSDTAIHANHNNNQYIRYKLFLATDDPSQTPVVSQVSIIHSSGCLPPGQTYFRIIPNDTYTLDVTLAGYTPVSEAVSVNGYTTHEITMTPI